MRTLKRKSAFAASLTSVVLAIAIANTPNLIAQAILLGLLLSISLFHPLVIFALGISLEAANNHFSLIFPAIGTISRLCTLCGAVIFFYMSRIRGQSLVFNRSILPITFLFVALLSMFQTISIDYSISPFFSLCINVFIFLLVVNLDESSKEYLLEPLTCIAIFLLFYIAVKTFFWGVDYKEIGGQLVHYSFQRVTIDFKTNPNQIGLGMNQLLPFVLFGIYMKKDVNNYLKLFTIATIAMVMFAMFKIGSRLSIISFFVNIMIWMYFTLSFNNHDYPHRSKFKKFFYVLVIFMVLVGSIYYFNIFDWPWLERFHAEKFARREHVVASVLKLIENHWLLGVGLGGNNEITTIGNEQGFGVVAIKPSHNLFLSVLAQLGIAGIIVMLVMLGRSIMAGWKSLFYNSYIIPFWACIIISCLLGIGETIFLTKILWLSMAMCITSSIRTGKSAG